MFGIIYVRNKDSIELLLAACEVCEVKLILVAAFRNEF